MSEPRPETEATHSVATTISRRVVQLMSDFTGRGPTRSRTTLNANFALIVLEDTLSKGERSLVAAGEADAVRTQRERILRLMEAEMVAAVEQETGRRVRVCLGDVAPEKDVAVYVFLFEPI